MKKIIVSALFAVLATASIASATTTWTNVTSPTVSGTLSTGVVGQTVFQVSTNVTLIGVGNAGGYNCSSKHLSGDKSYVSSSVSASVEEIAATKGVAMSAILLSTVTGNAYTGTGGF